MEYVNDEAAVRAALDGDQEAFSWLRARYEKRIRTIIYGAVRNDNAADELTESVFETAREQLDRCRGEFFPWICAIAQSASAEHNRRILFETRLLR